MQTTTRVEFNYADPNHNQNARRWWVLSREVHEYNRDLAALSYPDSIAAWEELTRQYKLSRGPYPFDIAFLSEGEVRRWTEDVEAGLTPEVESRWESYLIHTHVNSPVDRLPVAVVEITISPAGCGSDRHSSELVYEDDYLDQILDQIHEELDDDPDDPWGDHVSTEVVWLAPEGVEVGSEGHRSKYRNWILSE